MENTTTKHTVKNGAPFATAAPFFLDFGAVCRRLGREPNTAARVAFWRGVKAGRFPAPIQLSPARIAWRSDEIETWLATRPRVAYAHQVEAGEAVRE